MGDRPAKGPGGKTEQRQPPLLRKKGRTTEVVSAHGNLGRRLSKTINLATESLGSPLIELEGQNRVEHVFLNCR